MYLHAGLANSSRRADSLVLRLRVFQDSARNHLNGFLAVSQIPLLSRLFLDKNKPSIYCF